MLCLQRKGAWGGGGAAVGRTCPLLPATTAANTLGRLVPMATTVMPEQQREEGRDEIS